MPRSPRSGHVDHAAVLESLYEAALQPELLPQALHVYARALDGTIGVALDLVDHQGRVIVSPDGRAGAEAYAQGWWMHDIATQRGQQRRVRGIATNLDLTTAEERSSHPFFQEFGRQFECFWSCSHVARRPGAALSVSVRRPEECGPFLRADLERLAWLGRHAARAIDIAAKLADAASRSTALTKALTDLGYGVIALGTTGRVLFTNAAADSIVGDGMRMSNGALLATASVGQGALDLLISETLALAGGQAAAPPRPVALHRPSGRVPAVLYGIPVPPRHGDVLSLLGGRPVALLVIIEPDAARHLDSQLLQEMFGLSPGEARIAVAIATGATIKQAAARFGANEGTLRIVLKHVFQKVGVSRQAELVHLLAPLLRRVRL